MALLTWDRNDKTGVTCVERWRWPIFPNVSRNCSWLVIFQWLLLIMKKREVTRVMWQRNKFKMNLKEGPPEMQFYIQCSIFSFFHVYKLWFYETWLLLRIHPSTYLSIFISFLLCMCISVHLCTSVYICIYMSMWLSIYAYFCVDIYKSFSPEDP